MQKFLSIKSKITVTAILVVTTMVTILTLAGYQFFSLSFREAQAKQHTEILTVAAEHIDAEVGHAQENLTQMATALEDVRIAGEYPQKRLDSEKAAKTFFDGGFLLLDRRGGVLAATPLTLDHQPETETLKGFIRQAFTNSKPSISDPYLSAAPPHHPFVAFSVPVGKPGTNGPLLIGRHDLLQYNSLSDITKIALGSGGFLFLADHKRTVLMHRDPQRIMSQAFPARMPALDEAIGKGGMFFSEAKTSRGTKGVAVVRPLKRAPWVIGSFYPISDVYAPLDRARLFFAAAFLLVLATASIALWLSIKRTTAPLNRLTEHLNGLPEKEGEARFLALKTGDELESLAAAFNLMVAEMDLKHALLKDNQALYRIISQFTEEFAIWVNEDGSTRFISANCLALTGYADTEFYADHTLLSRIVHPEDIPLWEGHKTSPEACTTFNLRLIAKSGETRWFSHTCHRISDLGADLGGRGGTMRDITKAARLERELAEQQQFAESLLENTSTPLFVIDSEHRIIFWNRAMTELTGLKAEEMLGTTRQWSAFYPDERPTLSDLVLDGRTEEVGNHYSTFSETWVLPGIIRAESWYENIRGRKRYLVFDAAPVKREGRTVAVVETLYDLTERAAAEESLRLFSQAVEQTGSSILITDPDGTIQYVNRKFSEVTGYSKKQALGQNPRILKSGRQSDEVYCGLWETITKGGEWHGELHNRREDGTFFWESATISPIVDQTGKITHFLAVKEDVTNRKEAERALTKKQAELVVQHEQLTHLFKQVEQAKREWEQTMDCVDDMVIMADADHRLRRFNRAYADFTGKKPAQLLSKDWRDALNSVGLDATSVEGSAGELFHEPSRRWFALKTYPYGEWGGNVITLHDLTEIRRVTQELAGAYEELKSTHSQLLQQEKMASIGQLAAGVAHEINNPMGFISSNLGSMEKYLERIAQFLESEGGALKGCAPEKVLEEVAETRRKLKLDYVLADAKSLLAESRDGAERVRTIVANLKSFSRVDEAQSKYVDLNECLESTINIAWNELKYKTTLNREFGELPQVKCLPQQLNQVFLNILVNAAHAIEEKGEITVATRRDGESVLVSFKDTGCGIPEEIRNRIFEPFFTTKKVGQGTGLGLSISYDIIKKHNGSIEVESAPGKGTTFIIRLPIEGVQG